MEIASICDKSVLGFQILTSLLTLFSTCEVRRNQLGFWYPNRWNETHVYCGNVYSEEWQVRIAANATNATYRFPSITSTRSSAVALGSLIATSALLILYSLSTALISSWSIFVSGTVFVIAIPPLSFLRTIIAGGILFSRIPKPSSSDSMIFLSPRGLRTSSTMKMRLQVRATEGIVFSPVHCNNEGGHTGNDY